MKGALPEKWIEAAAGDRPSDVALLTLQNRLGAVLQCLPPAAKKHKQDVEHVHQLRIWTRRATAALSLYEEQMPRRRFSWMRKQLKRVRRAANAARDCDVLLARLKNKHAQRGTKRWLEVIRAERADAQQAIVAAYERLKHDDRFTQRIDKLLKRVRALGEEQAAGESVGFGDWARERLRRLVERFFATVPADKADASAFHNFRIRGKELRYALELLAGMFPDEARTKLYPTIEAMQDRLGEINDLATAMAWLQRKIESASDPKEAALWRRLLASEQAEFDQVRPAFWDWCTPQRLQELLGGFEALLGDSTKPAKTWSRPT